MSEVLTPAGPVAAPVASNVMDATRWRQSDRALRLLEGEWENDLRTYMASHIEASRLASWGPPSMALNLFKSLIHQLACLYDQEPVVRNDAFAADTEAEAFLLRLNAWPRMQRHSRLVIGLRESAIRIEHTPDAPNGISLRLVPPGDIEVEGAAGNPGVPRVIREARRRTINGQSQWTWDEWDIRDGEHPTYRVLDAERRDISGQVLGEEAGRYDWVSPVDQRPYLPWVLYHAEDTGRLWDHAEWHELIQGTYGIAMLWTFWIHSVKEASWDQKFAIDLVLQGLKTTGSGNERRARVAVDPTSLLMFSSTGDGRGSVGSIGASIDPLALAQAVVLYQQIVATHLGVSPADVQITSSSPQSGIAIALSREGLRKMQRRYKPQFKAGDEELLQKTAWVHNTFGDEDLPRLPVSGYRVDHQGIPLSAEEITSALEKNERSLEMGLKSEVDILMELDPGLTRQDAMTRLRQVAEERAEVARLRSMIATGGGGAGVLPPTEDEPDEPGPVADPAAPPAEDVASTALNGAQADTLKRVSMDVSAGTLSPDAARLMLPQMFPTMSPAIAAAIITASEKFTPATDDA